MTIAVVIPWLVLIAAAYLLVNLILLWLLRLLLGRYHWLSTHGIMITLWFLYANRHLVACCWHWSAHSTNWLWDRLLKRAWSLHPLTISDCRHRSSCHISKALLSQFINMLDTFLIRAQNYTCSCRNIQFQRIWSIIYFLILSFNPPTFTIV